MRSTTEHVTETMADRSDGFDQRRDGQSGRLSTRQLALGIAEIDTTARSLRDQAEQLKIVVATFPVEEHSQTGNDRRSLPAGAFALNR